MSFGFVSLDACPPGLFLFGETLCFKSEYSTGGTGGLKCDAYVVASGEYFWGGVSTVPERAKLMVQPVPIESWPASPTVPSAKCPPLDPVDFDTAMLAMSSLCDAIRRLERIATSAVTRVDVEEVALRRQSAERSIEKIAERRGQGRG